MAGIRDRIKSLRRVKASELIPHSKNYRRHPEAQAKAMSAALQEIGWADAVLVRETKKGLQIIDGHLRADIAPDEKIPCLVLDVTAKEAEKLLATFDPITAMADVDFDALRKLADGIEFDESALDEMMEKLLSDGGKGKEIIEDEVPEVSETVAITQLGDVWKCGRHRVMCGDCASNNTHANLLLTDPPYGIQKAEWGNEFPDELARELINRADCAAIMPGLWALPQCIQSFGDSYRWVVCGYLTNGMTHGAIGYSNWIPCVVGGKVPNRGQDAKDFTIGTEQKPDHPSPKPLRFIAWLVERLSDQGQTILDPFLGSGTTLIAAEQLDRTCYGIEIEPKYVDVILRRYMNLTNVSPVRESDGARFADLIESGENGK